MASTADAEAALAALLAGALASLTTTVKAIRGWPAPVALSSDIAAGTVVVSVYRLQQSRNTTRYLPQNLAISTPPASLTAAVSGTVATFGGTASLGQVAGVIVNGVAYPTRTQAGDTPSSVAARIAGGLPTAPTVTGSSIAALGLTDARTAADADLLSETGRQENVLQADIWCPTPPLRDAAEALTVSATSGATFLTMPDGSAARVRLMAVLASDETSNLTIYRLMLRVTAEVVIGPLESAALVLWPLLAINQAPPVVASIPYASA